MKTGDRNRKMLFLAILFGLLSAVLVFTVLKNADDSGGGSATSALVPVLVAKEDVAVGTQLTTDMVEISEVSIDDRLFDAYSDPLAVDGLYTHSAIAAGEQVTRPALALAADDLGLSYAIPPGLRAVSIEVDEATATGGLIQPGDYVDVVGIIFDQQIDDVYTSSATLAQNVKVLGIGQRTRTPQQIAADEGEAAEDVTTDPEVLTTVTLAVSVEQAEWIAAVETVGVIRLALRGFGDDEIVNDPGIRLINRFRDTLGLRLIENFLEGVSLPELEEWSPTGGTTGGGTTGTDSTVEPDAEPSAQGDGTTASNQP
jgi:pilus assembly protein CpaB